MRAFGRHAGGRWLVVLLFGALAACATPSRRGIDLSDAQQEAAKDDSEKRKVLVADEPSEEELEEEPSALELALVLADAFGPPGPGTAPVAGPTPPPDHNHLSLVGTGLTFASDVVESQSGPGVLIGLYPAPRLRVAFGGYFLHGTPGAGAVGFTDFEEWSGEASARFYFTSDHTLVGAYALTGFRAGLLHWNYDQPVTVQEGAGLVEIDDDMLTTYSVFVGVGLTPLQLSHFHLGGGVIVGTRLYQSVTHEGFDNDVFTTVGYRQVYVEATALF